MRWFVDPRTFNSKNPFGQFDPVLYARASHHPGSDYRIPTGTPIVAPCDGELFKATSNPLRGNTGVFVFTHEGTEWGLEICHLRELPKVGMYKEGEVIAFSGNTGLSTSPHLHVVMHKDATVSNHYKELINEPAFMRLYLTGRLVDPHLWFYNRIK